MLSDRFRPTFQICFKVNQIKYGFAERKKIQSNKPNFTLKHTFFTKTTAEKWQKHILTLGTTKRLSRVETRNVEAEAEAGSGSGSALMKEVENGSELGSENVEKEQEAEAIFSKSGASGILKWLQPLG